MGAVLSAFQQRTAKDETSRSFTLDDWGDDPTDAIVAEVLNIEKSVAEEYGLTLDGVFSAATGEHGSTTDLHADVRNGIRVGLDWPSLADQLRLRLQYAVGCAFGRWDIQAAIGGRAKSDLPDPFEPISPCSPGMLTGDDGLPVSEPPAQYSISFPTDGVLVDDPGHARDLTAAVRQVFDVIFGEEADGVWRRAGEVLERDIRAWLAREFAEYHRKQYSRPGRKAPIYWMLGTPSASYSVWLYAHRQSADSLFRVQRLVEEKLGHEQRRLTLLKKSFGENPSVSERNEQEAADTFVSELAAMLDEVKLVAPLWNPNLDDGIVLALTPLWRLFPQHRPWQNELKTRWDDLCAGNYDWSHLAMHLWPERVVPKCAEDVSLAIAHALVEILWDENVRAEAVGSKDGPDEQITFNNDEEAAKPRKKTKRPKGKQRWTLKPTVNKKLIDQLIAERTNPTVKAALKNLLEAPMPGGKPARKPAAPKALTRAKKAEAEGLF